MLEPLWNPKIPLYQQDEDVYHLYNIVHWECRDNTLNIDNRVYLINRTSLRTVIIIYVRQMLYES